MSDIQTCLSDQSPSSLNVLELIFDCDLASRLIPNPLLDQAKNALHLPSKSCASNYMLFTNRCKCGWMIGVLMHSSHWPVHHSALIICIGNYQVNLLPNNNPFIGNNLWKTQPPFMFREIFQSGIFYVNFLTCVPLPAGKCLCNMVEARTIEIYHDIS